MVGGCLLVKILIELEQTRALMIQSGMKYGFQNAKTIQLSEKLDLLMNEFDSLTSTEKNFDCHEKNYINNFEKNVYL